MTESARLLLGPIVRGPNPAALSIWVETSRRCEVEVLGRRAPTFRVGGHHYGLVELGELPSGSVPYDVRLDGERVWPDPTLDLPPSTIEPWEPPADYRIAAGSCRQQAPEPLWQRRGRPGFGELGPDALATLAHLVRQGRRTRPHLLLLTGDQVYADEQHPSVRQALRDRRGGPPREGFPEVTSFEEYSWLYQRTWSSPLIRWLLSCVPSLMIFDDHDVIDDWNISLSWTRSIARRPWWRDRLHSALASYWVYQHIGNLTPTQREHDRLYQAVVAADDGAELLEAFAARVASGSSERLTHSWSYHHRTGPLDLIVLDTRNARVLDPANRSMLSPRDWSLIETVLTGDVGPRTLIVSSVPWVLPKGIHRFEEWISALADGGVGRWGAALGEQIRRAIDLEHWAAFGASFERLRQLLVTAEGTAVTVLSGDVHFAYLAEVDLGETRVAHQVVTSPLRQVELSYERLGRRLSMLRPFRQLLDATLGLLGRRAGPLPYALTAGPWFENNIAFLTYHDDEVTARIDRVDLDEERTATLTPLIERHLSAVAARPASGVGRRFR